MGKKDSVDSTLDHLLDSLRISEHTHLIVAGVALLLVLVGVAIGSLF